MAFSERPLVLALALAGVCLICAAQEAAPTFSLLISTKQSAVQIGSELKVNIVLTNITDHPIWVGVEKTREAELEGYAIEVRDERGRLQRTSHYYWSLGRIGRSKLRVPKGSEQDYSDNHYDGLRPGSFANLNPDPGKTNEAWFDVSTLYAPLAPGRYTIQVQRTDEESKTEVKSNIITVNITK